MDSETAIANLALGRIKKGTIASFAEDSTEAEQAARLYPLARDYVLADFPWRVNTVVQTLAVQTNDREDDWAYKYQRPTCLRFRFLLLAGGRRSPRTPIPYEQTSAGLYCDVENARASILTRVTDTTLYSPALSSCIAWRLAYELVMPLNADLNLKTSTLRDYAMEKRAAWATDAAEEPELDDGTHGLPEFVAVRGAGPEPRW